MKDLKYLLAYLVPYSAMAALYRQGPWAWYTVTLAFVAIPLLEFWLPARAGNPPATEEESRAGRRFFDWLLYLNAPLLYLIVGWYCWLLGHAVLSGAEWLGLTLGVGIIVAAIGINVAHELGHRPGWADQALAKWMLLPALYQHFFIEHNRGHHKHVATRRDPATARFGENVYAFWVRSVWNSWLDAWALERERLQRAGKRFWTWENEMLRFQLFQGLWLVGIWVVFGPKALLGAIAVAVIGFLLLETINYIEHYGLLRRELPGGRPEPVTPAHSWNSDHELGRIFLYELTRHSDHHYKSTRKYQNLRHLDESPQLPLGYPASMILALLPPLWFRVMNKRIKAMGQTVASYNCP